MVRKTKGGESPLEEAFPKSLIDNNMSGGRRRHKKGGATVAPSQGASKINDFVDSIFNNIVSKGGACRRKRGGTGGEGVNPLPSPIPEPSSVPQSAPSPAPSPVPVPVPPLVPSSVPEVPQQGGKKGKGKKGGFVDFNITPFVTSLLLLGIRSAQQSGLKVKVDSKKIKKITQGGNGTMELPVNNVDISNQPSITGGKRHKRKGGEGEGPNFKQLLENAINQQHNSILTVPASTTGGKGKRGKKRGGEGNEVNGMDEASSLIPKNYSELVEDPTNIMDGGKCKKGKRKSCKKH